MVSGERLAPRATDDIDDDRSLQRARGCIPAIDPLLTSACLSPLSQGERGWLARWSLLLLRPRCQTGESRASRAVVECRMPFAIVTARVSWGTGREIVVKQKLRDELTAAMKSGDKTRTMVLRG